MSSTPCCYLVKVTPEQAAILESMLGSRAEIVPSSGPLQQANEDPGRAVIAGLDAVGFEGELAPVLYRLAKSGPRYHQGGPQSHMARAFRLRAARDSYDERGRLVTSPDPAGPDPYGGRGHRVGDHWEPPIGEAPSDEALGLSAPEGVSAPQPALVTCCPAGVPYYTETRFHLDGSRCRHRAP